MELIRLNKFLRETGICSRREADILIRDGRVTVNGKQAAMGMTVDDSCEILVDGKTVRREDEEILLAFFKPIGIVCTSEVRDGVLNVYQFLNYPKHIFTIGRLDKNSEGLLLLTNNGELVNRIMKASEHHEKEYEVVVDRPITDVFLEKMRSGIRIRLGDRGDPEAKIVQTRPCKVIQTGEKSFRITLTQGLNRQIRRMCQVLGYQVESLKRIRIMNLELGDLQSGEFRKVPAEEIKALKEQL